MKNKNTGVTLVALVVTIIILLILAGVAITTLKNTKLFENAKKANEKYQIAKQDEENKLNQYDTQITELTNSNRAENKNNYSTDEQTVGSWIDGKTLYQKTFKFTGQYYSNQTLTTGLTNIDTMFIKDGYYKDNEDSIYPLSYSHPTTSLLISYFIEKPNICIRFGSAYSYSMYMQEIVFTLLYTKL